MKPLTVIVHEQEVNWATGCIIDGTDKPVEVKSLEELWDALQKLQDPGCSHAWIELTKGVDEHTEASMVAIVAD